ncbi:ABC transporter substrate-binding protein [Streptomyces oceani]|uniref:ABC transporter substrate-binding protein n=1 Tax=Streptomyces oceani TaxID=1075402 RepID=A0A1E7KJT6_9ACTN|nr:sugar ABC transporter substrate-binding protein [Streptomyces oceani]OEV04114.1 ABC transporter substrate-binding protein [Streptomyces oceani]
MPSARPARRAAALAVVPAALSLLLTACGPGVGGPATSAEGPVEGDITFQTWNLRAEFKDYFETLIDEFESRHPDVRVEWADQPAENYADKLSADAGSGSLPDVINVSPDLAYPLADAGVIMNMDAERATAKYRPEYTKEAWDGYEMPGLGGTYAFPWYLNTGPLFYNKALLEDAGLDPEKPPRDYDALFRYAERIAERSEGRIPTLAATPTIENFGRYGVRLMNEDATEFTYNEPAGVELLTRYKKLYEQGGLDAQALTNTPEKAGQKFLKQRVAMNPGSALDLANFRNNAPSLYENLGITKAPNNTGRPNMYLMGLAVSDQSEHKPAAIAFAHFVTNKRNQEKFGHQTAVFPSTRGSLDKDYWSEDDGTAAGRVRVNSAQSLDGAVNYQPVVMNDEMETILRNEIAKALQGDKSPKQALDDAVAESNKLLRKH